MYSISEFIDRAVSLETTIKLCDELFSEMKNSFSRIPEEREPRLSDFSKKTYFYRTESYKFSIFGIVAAVIISTVLYFASDMYGFDPQLPCLLVLLLGASLGLIVMAFRRNKEKLIQKRAMSLYKNALDDYYAKHKLDTFTASMRSANILSSCENKLLDLKNETFALLGKAYEKEAVPMRARNFKVMCAALVRSSKETEHQTVKDVLMKLDENDYRLSKYDSLCENVKKVAQQTCSNMTSDDRYMEMEEVIDDIIKNCSEQNEKTKIFLS